MGKSKDKRKEKARSRAARKKSSRSEGVRKDGGGKPSRLRRSAARIFRLSPRNVILLVLVALFIAFSFGPTTKNLEATSRLKRKEAELKKQRSITATLEREATEARSMGYVEKEARRHRMVAPGEVLYLVISGNANRPIKHRLKRVQSMDEAWERVRTMMNCTYSRGEEGP